MAIKVIDEVPSSEVLKRCVCRNCGVTLEYTPADTRRLTVTDYTGGTDSYRVIDCPKCGEAIRTSAG